MKTSDSVREMWRKYFESIGELPPQKIVHDLFCDNQKDADELADLVLSGTKRATASSLWVIENEGGEIPKVGAIIVITNWSGEAICITRNTNVSIFPFSQATDYHAQAEGEGDGTLQYWKRVHLNFFQWDMAAEGLTFSEDMPIVFEEFEVVFPEKKKSN